MKKLVTAMIILWSLIGLMIVVILISGIVGNKHAGYFSLFPFSDGGAELLVDKSIPAKNLDAVNIELSSDICEVYLIDGDGVNIRHYGRGLSADRYVKISESGGSLTASTKNSVPVFGFGFVRYSRVEVYIPKSYGERLNIDISSGTLTIKDEMNLSGLNVRVGSGTIRADNKIKAETAVFNVNSGTIRLSEGLESAEYSVKAGSGTISVYGLTGSGGVEVNSGTIRLSAVDISESLSASAGSGTIDIGISGSPGLKFTGKKGSGTIKTYFGNYDGKDISAVIGEAPYKNLDVRVNSGTVRITQD